MRSQTRVVVGGSFFRVCDPEEVLLKWFRESRPPDVQSSLRVDSRSAHNGWMGCGGGRPSGPEILAEFALSGYAAGSHGQLCPPSMLTQIRPQPSAITYQMHISKLGQKSRSLNTDSEQILGGGCLPELHLNYVRNQKEPLTVENALLFSLGSRPAGEVARHLGYQGLSPPS